MIKTVEYEYAAISNVLILIFLFSSRKIKSDQNVLIICLCVSLFLGYLVFLTGVDNAQNEVGLLR